MSSWQFAMNSPLVKGAVGDALRNMAAVLLIAIAEECKSATFFGGTGPEIQRFLFK